MISIILGSTPDEASFIVNKHTSVLTGMFMAMTLLLLPFKSLIGQEARITEEQQVIKTYPFEDPNPVPVLAGSNGHIYPYFTFDKYHHDSIDEKWNVVKLENDYIEVSMLPEVGGKVWGALEKDTGEEFIYWNEVLKFRNIGLRGPWTSGGIEFNFGITGHTPATSTPVDYLISENDDGSVSSIVGGLDLASRTEWRVKVTLPPDKAFFETESFWYNPTPLNQSYYVWMNAAVEAADDLQFFFPGTHYVGHSGDVHPWPVDEEGRDLSYYKNNDFGPSKSYHILGKITEFYGGYWHDKDFGFGNWSLYSDMPGKKLWIWSLARSGGIWEDLLTDSDGQYVEVQSGRLFSQAQGRSVETPFDYDGFPPSRGDRWEELWFPVKETDGLSEVSPHGVLHVDHSKGDTFISLMGLQQLSDELKIFIDGELLSSETVSLEPLEVYRDTLDISGDTENLKLVLGDNKLIYNSSQNAESFDRPLENSLAIDEPTAAHLYQRAKNQADNRNYSESLKTFSAVIEKDPAFTDAYTGLAELYYRRGEYEKALQHSREALSQDTYNARANFIHGIIKNYTGETASALEALGWAARSNGFRSAAFASMAEIYLKTDRLDRAVEFAGRSLNYNWNNINAYKILAISYRMLEDSENAQAILDQMLEIDPLNHFARFEHYLLDENEDRLEEFTSLIRNELPHETYLEMAVFYASADLESEAMKVLEHAPNHPMVWFWRGYLSKDRSSKESRNYLDRALSASPDLVFPFRTESIPVLEWAREQDDSWKSSYYLGLIYWNAGRTTEAGQLYTQLEDKPDFAPFYLTRGELREQMNESNELILKDYQKAKQLEPEEWRSWHALTDHYMKTGAIERALDNAEQAYKKFPDRDPIEMGYVKALLASEDYKSGTELLDSMHILPYEGASEGRVLFERAYSFLALEQMEESDYKAALRSLQNAQTWPEQLGAGKPYNPDLRLHIFLEAAVNQELGNNKQADKLYTQVAEYTQNNHGRKGSGLYFGALALKKEGDGEEARTLLEKWEREESENSMAAWALARFDGNIEQARKIEQQILDDQMSTDSPFPLLIEAARTLDRIADGD